MLRILSHQLGSSASGTPIRLRTPEAAFDEIRQNVAGYDLSLRQLCSRAAAELAPASPQTRRRGIRRAGRRDFFVTRFSVHQRHPGPLLLQAHFDERGKADAVNVHLPAPSPGGIASQDRRPAVYCADGPGLSHLVRAQSRRAHSVALGPVPRRPARIAAAAGRRREIPVQGRRDAAGRGPDSSIFSRRFWRCRWRSPPSR